MSAVAWATYVLPGTENTSVGLGLTRTRNTGRLRLGHARHRARIVMSTSASAGRNGKGDDEPREKDKNNDVSDSDERPKPGDIDAYHKLLLEVTEAETAFSNPFGTKMSHEIIRFDDDGLAPLDRFVYVEERDCIGCSHCATTAPMTFFLEEAYGRARAFDQTGDDEGTVEVAIDTCPVNCIYYVDWEDLVKLETSRKEQIINNWTRLVGGQDISASRAAEVKTKVMDSGIMRCEDCPHRGCSECPLYGVGENPEFKRRKAVREAKKRKPQKRKPQRRRL